MIRRSLAEPGAPESRGAWGLGPAGWAAAASGLHLVAGVLLFEPTLFSGGDNAGYVILGEALRSGAGYVDLYLPEAPIHTKFPPAYPALLALLGWVGGVQLFKAVSLLMTAGAVYLTVRLGTAWLGTRGGALAGLVLALNPVLLEYGHWILSEAPFVVLVMLSLWALERGRAAEATAAEAGRDPVRGATLSRRWWGLGLLAAVAAFLTRTAGLPLLLAVSLAPLLAGRRRRGLVASGTTFVVAGGWALFQRLGAPGRTGYLQELLMVDPYDPSLGRVDLAGLFGRLAENAWAYVSGILPTSLTGAGGPGGEASLLAVAGIALAALTLGGWVERGLRRLGAAELFLALYAGLIALWPEVWTDRRFLLPALPLVVLYALLGARRIGWIVTRRLGRGGGRSGTREGWGAAIALSLALAVPASLDAARKTPDRIRCLAAYRADRPCQPAALTSFYQAARWARDGTPEEAVVVNRKPRLFYLFSKRRGAVYRFSSEPRIVLDDLYAKGADYVVVDAISGTTVRYLVPSIEAHPDRFSVVYREGRPPTWILRLRPERPTASR